MNKKLIIVNIITMLFILILSIGSVSATITVTNIEKLTDNIFMDTEPDWSPDDSKIIYMKYHPSDWWTNSAIYEMSKDGTDKNELIPVTSWHAKYSPDGTKIAYEEYYGTFIIKDLISGINDVLLTSSWGYGGFRSSWSPDGKKIVYSRNNPVVDNYEIWVYDLEARTNTKLTTENFEDGYGEIYPTWSPDGTKIAFMRQFDIWLMNPDGTDKVDITNTPNIVEDPYSWSPDSSMIAYTCFENHPNGERSSPNDICVINKDGTGTVKLTTDDSFHDSHPAWSHSGDMLVFESNRAGNYDIWVMELSFNQPPIADADGPYVGNEGSTINIDGSGSSDPDENIVSYEWDLNNDGLYDDAFGITTDVVFDDSGIYTIGLKVTDENNEVDSDITTVAVNNVPPKVNAGADDTINEGDSFSSSSSFSDPGADTWTATVNYGDRSSNQPLMLNPDKTFSLSHTYAENGAYTVTVTVRDDDGGEGSDTALVTVNNVAPSIISIENILVNPVPVGTTILPTATFTDPGTLDTHNAVWDWDGLEESSPGNVDQNQDSVIGSHTFNTPGIYTIKLTVTDDDGGSDTAMATHYLVVYDSEGGFVTGGGWIDSPVGAYIPQPSLTGKTNFGFVSKYKKGATTPTGQTEFQFKVADLKFHSDNYDWLVIAGHKAMYKGIGTINGKGNFGFLLSAVDEALTHSTDVDLFRIKIWDMENNDAVVYDNQMENDEYADPTTVISSGSIVIHKK